MKILIVYYSMYGHTWKLAPAVAQRASKIPGAEVMLRRVQEFEAVERIIDQNEAARQVRQQQQNIPICTVDDRRSADGVIFGSPTRYGNMMAQMKQLIDTSRKQSLYREIAPNAVNVAF